MDFQDLNKFFIFTFILIASIHVTFFSDLLNVRHSHHYPITISIIFGKMGIYNLL